MQGEVVLASFVVIGELCIALYKAKDKWLKD